MQQVMLFTPCCIPVPWCGRHLLYVKFYSICQRSGLGHNMGLMMSVTLYYIILYLFISCLAVYYFHTEFISLLLKAYHHILLSHTEQYCITSHTLSLHRIVVYCIILY